MNYADSNWDDRRLVEIKKYVQDSRWQVRAAAARLLAVLGYKAPLDILKILLEDDNRNVRIAAVEACVALADRLSVEWVIRFLDDKEWSVRSAAAWAAGFYGLHTPAERLLLIVNSTEEDHSVRASALVSLGKANNPDYRERIVEALHDPAWEVREAAIQILEEKPGDLPDTLFMSIWQHDSSPYVRAAALRCIAHYRKHEALLWQALDDEEVVCRTAVEMLKHRGEHARAELLGVVLLLPMHSNVGRWIQEELDQVAENGDAREITWELLNTFLHPTFYQPRMSTAYPSHLSLLALSDIRAQRPANAWRAYSDALEQLMFHAKEPIQQLATAHYRYHQVLEHVGQAMQAQFPQWKIMREQSLLPGLLFEIGAASVEVRWQKENIVYMVKGDVQEDITGYTPVNVRLHFALWDDERQQISPLTASTIVSGYTANGKQLQQDLLSWFLQQDNCLQLYEQIAKRDDPY